MPRSIIRLPLLLLLLLLLLLQIGSRWEDSAAPS
jgi:hypothetical protein